jgi:hypothetical protein
MKTIKPGRLILLMLLGSMIWLAAGCGTLPQEAAAPANLNPTVIVVQYVTQVVATVTPSPPTATPLPPTALPVKTGYDPFDAPIYYPLMGCPVASRIRVGDRVFVANNRGGTLGLHFSANVGYAPIFRKLSPGEILDVIDGPYCRTQSLVWEVIASDGRHGFVSEGNGEVYWLLPLGEKVDKKLLKPTPDMGIRLGVPAKCQPR